MSYKAMKIKQITSVTYIKKASTFLLAVLLLVGVLSALPGTASLTGKASAACLATAPPTTYGQVTQTVNVTTAGTYRVWSRIKAPDTTANSYYFQADGGCAYNVGDSTSIPASTWTWVNYQDGTTSSTVNVTLTAGAHTLTYTGKEANVQLDRVLLLTDLSCVPTGTGDNCAVNDTTSPSVGVDSPLAGATVSGTVTIAASASDASGVKQVEFLIDNVVVSTDTTSAYSYSWNTTTATNGTHTLTARATDNANNVGTSTAVSVTVNNTDSTAPIVTSFTATPASVVAGDTVAMAATATDNVAVTKVEFYSGTTLLGTDTTAPYSYNWVITTGSTLGAHAMTAKAYDAAGNSKSSPNVTVTVNPPPDTTLPTVSITAPVAGASYTVGATVTINATATDNVAVAKVEFYDGTTLLNSDAASPYTYAWNTTGAVIATHALTAKAYDTSGNVKASAAVSITIAAQTTGNGDVNLDGRVNALDLSALISHDGQNYPAADFNNDGTVGAADMAILLANWTW